MVKSKILFFEELGANSALRKKLRISHPRNLYPGYRALALENLRQNSDWLWESRPESWPRQWSVPPTGRILALSSGHIFNEKKIHEFSVALRSLSNSMSDGLWILQGGAFENFKTRERLAIGCDFLDLNGEIEDFDFSLLASRPRHFNQIKFGREGVTKTSLWKEKGIAEIEFLKSIPKPLSNYYPSILSQHIDEHSTSYTMRNQRCFDMGRLVSEGALDEADWSFFYAGLKNYFSKLPVQEVSPQEVRTRLENLFVSKLQQRMQIFRQFGAYPDLLNEFFLQTGHHFEERVEQLSFRIRSVISESETHQLLFSHGDMSFSNILYDIETHEICFVDPRGKSEDEDCFRPLEYDLAKLSHSALGQYESICQSGSLLEKSANIVSTPFLKFIESFPVSLSAIRLYEASLFWSLLPLHLDYSSQLMAFMLAGERALMAV